LKSSEADGAAAAKDSIAAGVADIEAVLCSFYGLRALNPQRA
jgi:hypothetical protein